MGSSIIYKTIFVHYGSDTYNPCLIKPVKNYHNKPEKGTCLWACPVSSKNGWYEWCQRERFEHTDFSKAFFFKIHEKSKVLVINSLADMRRLLPIVKCDYPVNIVDFERLYKEETACIWLTDKGQWETHLAFPTGLYGWDCESLLVLKPDSIYQIPFTRFLNTLNLKTNRNDNSVKF